MPMEVPADEALSKRRRRRRHDKCLHTVKFGFVNGLRHIFRGVRFLLSNMSLFSPELGHFIGYHPWVLITSTLVISFGIASGMHRIVMATQVKEGYRCTFFNNNCPLNDNV